MSDKKIKIAIGLEQQGHIETIENYFKKYETRFIEANGKKIDPKFAYYHWEDIGRIIGWCPLTACLAWFEYQDNLKDDATTNYRGE